jgi:hypothetical protein
LKNLFIDNSNISHLSFDFWDTLAFSNPEFKFERTKLIGKYYSQSPSDIQNSIKETGKKYNLLQETNIASISPIHLLKQAMNDLKKKTDVNIE